MNGSKAAFAQAALSLASVGTGLAILASIEGGDPAAFAGAASAIGLSRIGALALAAETFKAVAALCLIPVVKAASAHISHRLARPVFLIGFIAAIVLLASALAGMAALVPSAFGEALTRGSALLGLAAMGLVGLWALVAGAAFLASGRRRLGTCGVLFGLASLPLPLVPLVAVASFVLGLIWWVLLGLHLARVRPQPVMA